MLQTPSEEARVRHKKTDETTPDDEGGDDEDDGEPGSEEEISPDTASGVNADMERDEEEVEEEAASKDVKTDHAEQRVFKKTSKTALEVCHFKRLFMCSSLPLIAISLDLIRVNKLCLNLLLVSFLNFSV